MKPRNVAASILCENDGRNSLAIVYMCVFLRSQEDIAYKEYVYNFDDKCPQYIQGVPHYEVRARHVFSGSTTFQGQAVEMPSDGGQKWCVEQTLLSRSV